jgi:hypothetical protein
MNADHNATLQGIVDRYKAAGFRVVGLLPPSGEAGVQYRVALQRPDGGPVLCHEASEQEHHGFLTIIAMTGIKRDDGR